MNFCKEEQLDVLELLIKISNILDKCQIVLDLVVDDDLVYSEENERYLEMAIKLDPNDSFILYRK